MHLNEEEAKKLGQAVVDLLGLTVKGNGRVDTNSGDKTLIGLGRTVVRVVQENVPRLADTSHGSEPLNPNEPPFDRGS